MKSENLRSTLLATAITLVLAVTGCNDVPVDQGNQVTQQAQSSVATETITPSSSLTSEKQSGNQVIKSDVKPKTSLPKVAPKPQESQPNKRSDDQPQKSALPRRSTEQTNVSKTVESATPIREEEEEPTVRSLNGQSKSCDVYSSKTGRTYTLEVDFEGDTARINFPNGGYKYVDIDSPDSTNFKSISATDRDGESWDISVDSPPTR